jgi:transposase-like protein
MVIINKNRRRKTRPLIDHIVYVICTVALWALIWAIIEQIRFITGIVGWPQTKSTVNKQGWEKRAGPAKKEIKRQQPCPTELEATVRQMFPEPPEPTERSLAAAATVTLLKQSARGLFDLLPEETCAGILKRIAGAGKRCPRCGGQHTKKSKDPHYRQYYTRRNCRDCHQQGQTATFYELTGTIFEGSHLSPRQWLWGLFLFVGGCSTLEIATELKVNLKTAQRLVALLQLTLITGRYRFLLTGKVEFDEVYLIGGLKGRAGKLDLDRAPRRRGLRLPGRGIWQSDKVPILGLVDRQGHIYLVPCANVQSDTIRPLIEYLTDRGATLYTDEYNIYNFLRRVGYQHQTVNHSKGEYARGQVHVNTVEGLWSLLRDHLRIHRGVSKLYLPLYVMRFEFLTNHRNQSRWEQMLDLCGLACQADGVRLRRLVREKQLHTACPILGLSLAG